MWRRWGSGQAGFHSVGWAATPAATAATAAATAATAATPAASAATAAATAATAAATAATAAATASAATATAAAAAGQMHPDPFGSLSHAVGLRIVRDTSCRTIPR